MRITAVICLITLFSCFFNIDLSQAQNNPYGKVKGDTLYSTGWSFGLNMGAYFANKYQGNFYNGDNSNMDSINLVFGNQWYWYQIKNDLLIDTFHNLQIPLAMHYQPAIMIGFHFKYNLYNNLGIFLQFNYQGLTAKDVVSIDLGPQAAHFDSTLFFPIWGKEDRMNIDLGISKDFSLNESISVFAEGGMNINYAKVKEHKILIGNVEYELVNRYVGGYQAGVQLQENPVYIGGWGMGGFLSAGFRFIFNNSISLDPGATFYWNQVKLPGYSVFKPHFDVFVRLSYQKLVDREKFRGER